MEYRVLPELRDRFLKMFPRGPPEDIGLQGLNSILGRVGLYVKTKCPGFYYEVALLKDHPRSCPYGCVDPTCRSLHDLSPEDVEYLWEVSFERFYDELYGGLCNFKNAMGISHRNWGGVATYLLRRGSKLRYYYLNGKPGEVAPGVFPVGFFQNYQEEFPLLEIASNPSISLADVRERISP